MQHVHCRHARHCRPAGVEEHITRKWIASEPGRSRVWPSGVRVDGPHREGEEPKPMMHGRGKSDSAIVAVKPTNKAGANAAEPVEPRAGTKGNAGQQSTYRAQSRARVSQALERIRKTFAVTHPRWEPYAGKPHVRIWAGGREVTRVPTAKRGPMTGCGPKHKSLRLQGVSGY